MAKDLKLRFVISRRGLARTLGWGLVLALPMALLSQTDPSRSVTIMTLVQAVPMGAFGSLIVNGAAGDVVSLARDGAAAAGGGGRVAIGRIGNANPAETLVVVPNASFGANIANAPAPAGAAAAQVYSSAVNPANTAGVGMFLTGFAPARFWSIHSERLFGEGFDTLWWERNNTKVFGISQSGTLRVCSWRRDAACTFPDITMYSGMGPSPDAVVCGCPCGAFVPPGQLQNTRCRSCNTATGQPGYSEFYACPPTAVAAAQMPGGWGVYRLCCSLRRI